MSLNEALSSLRTCSDSLRALESYTSCALMTLRNIRTRLDEKCSDITQTTHVVRISRSLSNLPDDVFALVFDFAVKSYEKRDWGQAAFKISSVCRRFHDIALRLPSIWSYVHPGMEAGVLKACMEHSRDVGLRVVFPTIYSGERDEFVEQVAALAHRWTSLSIATYLYPFMGRVDHWGRLSTSFLQASRLQSIRIHAPRLRTESQDLIRFFEQLLSNLMGGASTTSLLDLRTDGSIRIPTLPATLTCLKLNFEQTSFDTAPLLNTLSDLRVLKQLSLCFCNYDHDSRTNQPDVAVVEIASLEDFSIEIWNSSADFDHCLRVLPFLYFPNMANMAFRWRIMQNASARQTEAIQTAIDSIFSAERHYPRMKNLDLDLIKKSWAFGGVSVPSDILVSVRASCASLEGVFLNTNLDASGMLWPSADVKRSRTRLVTWTDDIDQAFLEPGTGNGKKPVRE